MKNTLQVPDKQPHQPLGGSWLQLHFSWDFGAFSLSLGKVLAYISVCISQNYFSSSSLGLSAVFFFWMLRAEPYSVIRHPF